MKKINFLAPPESTGGTNNHDPNLQLLKEIFPGKVTLTVTEAKSALNVSDDFIYERLASGEIKGRKTGRNWIIPLTEVARLLNHGVK